MNRILQKTLVFVFIIAFSSIYVSKTLWACGEGEGYSRHESGEHVVQTKAEGKGEKAEVVIDPVCGMNVSDIKKAPSEEYKGKVYYFCSENCKKTFKKSPVSFIEGLLRR